MGVGLVMKVLSHAEIESVYTNLMGDTKWRLFNLDGWLLSLGMPMPDDERHSMSELCFLNFRRICENIAIATLVAHNKLPEATTKTFRDEWNLAPLFKSLYSLNRDCFPVKLREREPSDNEPAGYEMLLDSYLSSDKIKEIYGRSCDMLHAGNLRSLLKGKDWSFDVSEMQKWLDGLFDHLRCHAVILPRFEYVLICVLHTRERGDVSVAISGDVGNLTDAHRRWGTPEARHREKGRKQ